MSPDAFVTYLLGRSRHPNLSALASLRSAVPFATKRTIGMQTEPVEVFVQLVFLVDGCPPKQALLQRGSQGKNRLLLDHPDAQAVPDAQLAVVQRHAAGDGAEQRDLPVPFLPMRPRRLPDSIASAARSSSGSSP
jgi:hypothetical protein